VSEYCQSSARFLANTCVNTVTPNLYQVFMYIFVQHTTNRIYLFKVQHSNNVGLVNTKMHIIIMSSIENEDLLPISEGVSSQILISASSLWVGPPDASTQSNKILPNKGEIGSFLLWVSKVSKLNRIYSVKSLQQFHINQRNM
jgi:hypothetical protein